jgi:hypothetical protein
MASDAENSAEVVKSEVSEVVKSEVSDEKSGIDKGMEKIPPIIRKLLAGGTFASLGLALPDFEIEASAGDIVKYYLIIMYSLSLLKGLQKGVLKSLTDDELAFKEVGSKGRFIRDDFLRLINAFKPVKAVTNFFGQEKGFGDSIDFDTRFWTTRGGIRYMYDPILDGHYAVVEYPFHLFQHLLSEANLSVENSVHVKIITDSIENGAKEVAKQYSGSRSLWMAEYGNAMVYAANSLIFLTQFEAFKVMLEPSMRLVLRQFKLGNATDTEIAIHVHNSMRGIIDSLYHKDSKMSVAFALLVDLLVHIEDRILEYVEDEDGYMTRFGSASGIGFFRCYKFKNVNPSTKYPIEQIATNEEIKGCAKSFPSTSFPSTSFPST